MSGVLILFLLFLLVAAVYSGGEAIRWIVGSLVVAGILLLLASVISSGIWIEREHIRIRRLVRAWRVARPDVLAGASVDYSSAYAWLENGIFLSEAGIMVHAPGGRPRVLSSPGAVAQHSQTDLNAYLLNRWILAPVRAAERAAGPRWPQPGDSTRLRTLIEEVLLDTLKTLDRPRTRIVERDLVNEIVGIALDHGSAAKAAERALTRWVGTRGRVLDQPAKAKLRADLRATGGFDPFWWHGVQAPAEASAQ